MQTRFSRILPVAAFLFYGFFNSQPGIAAFTSAVEQDIDIDGDGSCYLRLMKYYDPSKQPTGGYKAIFILGGNAWKRVQAVSGSDSWVIELVDNGYKVYSTEYRGVVSGGDLLTDSNCGYVDEAQQKQDITAALTYAAYASNYTDVDLSHGWILAGFSAGGHLAAWLGRNFWYQPMIRGVATIKSPVSFWNYWSFRNGTSDLELDQDDRILALPDGGSSTIDFTLEWGDWPLIYQEYFAPGSVGVTCDLINESGEDCFFKHHDAPGEPGFILGNTFSAENAEAGDPPMLMIAGTLDWVIPADSIHAVCESYGTLGFVDHIMDEDEYTDLISTYIADCGSTNNRFILLEGVDHTAAGQTTFNRVMDWAESSALN